MSDDAVPSSLPAVAATATAAALTAAWPPVPADALPAGCVRLADWGLIRARGADAASFLHGQLTQDTLHLAAGQARLAGYCSAKGRLLASFVMWRPQPDELMLACSADLLAATLKRLSMFVLRAKCKLDDASAELPLWGLAGTAAAQALGDALPAGAWAQTTLDGIRVTRLPDAGTGAHAVPRFILAGALPPGLAMLPALDAAAWRWLEVQSGVARIQAATSEHFVPQMVNLELVGGVNFQKGCYPGQEVVARSQYRGTVKRRSQVLHGGQALQPGQEVFHSADADQPAGEVVLAGSLALPGATAHHAALVELKLAALHGGTLLAGTPTGPLLTLAALPYEFPSDAA
jgi:folate-binding protein YgfZ